MVEYFEESPLNAKVEFVKLRFIFTAAQRIGYVTTVRFLGSAPSTIQFNSAIGFFCINKVTKNDLRFDELNSENLNYLGVR